MISEQEYGKLLKHLIDQLQVMNLNEISDDINQLLKSGKTEVAEPDEGLREQKINVRAVGKTKIIPFSQEEAFKLAIEYLKSIIIEMPKYKEKIQKELGQEIIWELDQAENLEDVLVGESFSIEIISFQQNELEKISQIFVDLLEQNN